MFQEEDVDISPILTWIEQKHEPAESELRLHGPGTRSLWLCKLCFKIIDGVLYYQFIGCPDRDICLVVPAALKNEVFRNCHDVKSAGHLGQKKTLDRLKRSFLWYSMSRDSEENVRSCSVSNQNKKIHIRLRALLG